MDKTPLYKYPAAYARENGELEVYRASHKANIACRNAIEIAIRENYQDNCLGKDALKQDKCGGTIPRTVFQTLMHKYEAERAEKAALLPALERKIKAQRENRQDADHWTEIIRRYTEVTELDETILFELIDRIEVGEARREGAVRVCDVKVFYRYVGNVDDALERGRRERYDKAV